MRSKELAALLERADNWPPAAQNELLEIAREIEQSLIGEYQATPEEVAAIEEGLADARAGRFATDEEVEAVFAKFRQK